MTTRNTVVIASLALATAFATGRWSVRSPTIKTTQDIHESQDKTQDKNVHTQTTITSTKKPDGTVETTTHVNSYTTSKSDEKDTTAENIQQTVTPPKTGLFNISALVYEDSTRISTPLYGLVASKEVLGPVRAGVFWLPTSHILGLSIGLDF
jgi:hypothetical protein